MNAAHVLAGAVGAALVACGTHFLVRELTGKTPFEHARDLFGGDPPLPLGKSPTARADRAAPPPPTDPVDESSWESFPASDPPAHSPKNA